ncbi:MAG: hypothetical protein ACI4LX_04940 [Treponema sp.]
MKKKLMALLFAAVLGSMSFAQVLEKSGVQNNLWTGMGLPTGTPNSAERSGFRWFGLIDTIQARVDVYKFTIDGMLAWGALTEWTDTSISGFSFVNTDMKPVDFLYHNFARTLVAEPDKGRIQNAYNKNDPTYGNNSYYLNFLWHPFTGFDVGIGTRLEWDVGPAPSYGAYAWEYKSHVHQGDLRDGNPESVPVAGYIKYANTYAQKAIALRYKYKDIVEVGFALPSGCSSDLFTTNFGFSLTPVKFITVAFAYEGLFINDSNLYTGLTFRFTDSIMLDAYLAFNDIGTNYSNAGKWGTGAALMLGFPKIGLYIRPEVGFTGYANSDYTLAVYTGAKLNFDFAKRCHLGCWVSFAWGAEKSSWHKDGSPYDDYFGGFIFNIRPEFAFDINANHTIAVTTEFESLTDYKRDVVDSLLIGFYWRFKTK